MSRSILPVLTLLAAFLTANGAIAQLNDFKARQKIAADKLKVEVKDAIARSRQLEKTDTDEAKFLIRRMISRVDSSDDLAPSERPDLLQQLRIRLNQIEDAARANRIVQDQRPIQRDPPKYKPPVTGPNTGPGGFAKGFIDGSKSAQLTQADLIRERQRGLIAINLGIEKSHVPIGADPIEFPKNWKALSAARKEFVSPKLTPKEVALLKTLNSVLSVDYQGDKFKAVLQHLRDRTGLTIIVDEQSLADAMSDYDTPIEFKAEKISVRFALKSILANQRLTYIIKEGAIQVMTPKKASEHLVTRTYQVDDLIAPDPQMAMMFGPFVAQAQMMQNAQMLINLIQMSIEPSYWQPNGPGSIVFFPPTRSLIIRGSTEMHYQLGAPGLFGGR